MRVVNTLARAGIAAICCTLLAVPTGLIGAAQASDVEDAQDKINDALKGKEIKTRMRLGRGRMAVNPDGSFDQYLYGMWLSGGVSYKIGKRGKRIGADAKEKKGIVQVVICGRTFGIMCMDVVGFSIDFGRPLTAEDVTMDMLLRATSQLIEIEGFDTPLDSDAKITVSGVATETGSTSSPEPPRVDAAAASTQFDGAGPAEVQTGTVLPLGSPDAYAQTEKRVALVIGNGAYADSPLINPVNDAHDMAMALRDLGFEVIHRENIDRIGMRSAVRDFSRRIRQGGVGLFYFAGHGVQVNGSNFLIPVGTNIEEEFEVADEGLNADSVLRAMEEADNRLNIIILDACRNNPFARSYRSASRGLARMAAPTGSLVAYATAPGKVAADGDGRNGTFTKHLLGAMRVSGRTLEQVFKQVRINVERETDGRQIPWEESSLTGDFYFKPAVASVATPPPQETMSVAAQREQVVWQGIAGSNNAADYEQFLRDYPDGYFSAFAENRLAELRPQQVSSTRSAGISALPVADSLPKGIVYLTGHGELKRKQGPMNADQHYQHVAEAIKAYLAGRQVQIVDQGILPGERGALQARLGTLPDSGRPLLYLTVVGASRQLESTNDVITLECYTPDNKLRWREEATNAIASSREESLSKAVLRLEKRLDARADRVCLH